MPTPTKVVQKCKNCGGDLFFNPSKSGLICKGCGDFQSITSPITAEKSFQSLLSNAPTWQKDSVVLCCEHCGAKSVVSKFDLVAKCDYCGAANMVNAGEVLGLRPDTIVLFAINRTNAMKQVSSWLSKRLFVPSQFKQQLKDRQLNGIYFPAFTFDTNVITRYTGTLVETNTTTTVIDGKEVTQSETVRRALSDVESESFDDILILANKEITPKTLSELGTFDTNHGQVFQQSYLAGFTVCGASKEPQECWNQAKKSIESVISNKLTTRYVNGNTDLENLHLDLVFNNITYKYVLLPIYVGHVEYKGTKYPLYLNGQTGKICGKTPKSWWKMLLTFTAMGLMAFGAGIILAMFL